MCDRACKRWAGDRRFQNIQRASQGDGYAIRSAWILLSIGLWHDIYFRGGEIVSQHSDLPARIQGTSLPYPVCPTLNTVIGACVLQEISP